VSLIARLRRFEIWFQLHWFAGITAGTVLVVVGVTGGLMSFQQDILEWINAAAVEQLESEQPRLSPPALIARYEAQHPDHSVASLYWRQDRPYPALIGYRTPETTGRRGERAILNPFTAQPMPLLRGQWTFGLIRQIHQRLAAGDTGKFIVGVSTITLAVLSLTGLYLRWQRRPRHGWRWIWPRALGGKLAGEWHAVLGIWVLAAYLIAALTGLWWSFDWYRNGAQAILASAENQTHPTLDSPVERTDMARLWSAVADIVADSQSVFIRLPDKSTAVAEVRYVPSTALHEFANDEVFVHPGTGAILGQHRFDELSAGDKLLKSVYALHMGAFFGTPGVVIMMLASFAMPVFFVTGWLLYVRRRRMKHHRLPMATAASTPLPKAPAGADAVLVAHASQSGLAERIAHATALALQQAGHAVRSAHLGELSPTCLGEHHHALFVVSTHGEGDAPVTARRFDRSLAHADGSRLEQLDYALLSLGDRDYADSFCAFGRRLDRHLRERGARTLITPIEVDKGDAAALADWHELLNSRFGATHLVSEPIFDHWRLVERRILNPDSQGGPTAWLRLVSTDRHAADQNVRWQAGDIAEIRPQHAPAALDTWLESQDISRATQSHSGDALRARLADRQLPAPHHIDPITNDWLDALPPIAARDYSIANSDSGDGVELLVRLARHDTTAGPAWGVASGWLVEHAALGERVLLRLRANPGFRADPASAAAPAIFIGNGTGLAGLRAHLQTRIGAGQHANWLIFGERQSNVDFYCRDEICAWHATGALAHLDAVFSRDASDGRYVQQALADRGERLLDWINDGAFIFVCGSHTGMAPGVTDVLTACLGADRFSKLSDEGRIRMDVY